MKPCAILGCLWLMALAGGSEAATVLVEAESFSDHGGWVLDTQSIEIMGSPYLLAHGLGRPTRDATTTVHFSELGTYRVFVRTKDWVARWDAPGSPGRFELWIDGKALPETFGTKGKDWFWHEGGTVDIQKSQVTLALHDLTGFDGRCDAICFVPQGAEAPPNVSEPLAAWRRRVLGLPDEPTQLGPFDLVVVGGGYSGIGAAVSAARMGCKVALIQNRPVLGGNGSSEVRVSAEGLTRRGRFPHIGEIVEEFADNTSNVAAAEEFGDEKKEKVVREEKNISLLLNHHVYDAQLDGERVASVLAMDTRTSERKRLVGKLFADCTGHGTVGHLAGAFYEITEKKHMGMSNLWSWAETDRAQSFPDTPWALDLDMEDFPYPGRGKGEWFWESGFDKHPIDGLEATRDWNLRAVYGAFNAMKNRGGADDHHNAQLTWVAYIGGPRESRRLMGDVLLTKDDVVNERDFPDGCVPSTWSIDLHYPEERYQKKYPENPFISKAVYDHRVDKNNGYPIPYRCFYSRNVPNLFMAGRCISVTHEALGTVRVMKTCGMMGEVVGKAASICVRYDCPPRDVYQQHLEELKNLLRQPGRARRATVRDPIVVLGDPPPPTSGGIAPGSLAGVVIDNPSARATGTWSRSAGVPGFIGDDYVYAGRHDATMRYDFQVPNPGRYEIRMSYTPHENRASNALVTVHSAEGRREFRIDQKTRPKLEKVFVSLGVFPLEEAGAVVISAQGAQGTVVADAVQVVPAR
jgi:hypothetical protein